MALPDILIGGLLLYGFIRGLWKGLFTELAALVSLLLGFYIAVKFSGYVGEIIANNVSWEPKYVKITAFAITFILVVVGVILLAKVFTKLASFAMLGWLNRLLGGVFGFIKWALIISVLLNFFVQINRNYTFAEKETLDDSWFFYPILKISNTVYPVLEEWFATYKLNEDKEDADTYEYEPQTDPEPIEGMDREI